MRKCLNLKSFAFGVDKARIGRTDSVGKMCVNGQGNCHGVSSTMGSVLYAFSGVLGIDVKYRGGYTFWRA